MNGGKMARNRVIGFYQRRFNGAAVHERRKGLSWLLWGATPAARFNGAAVHERRKEMPLHKRDTPHYTASTEPPFMNGGKHRPKLFLISTRVASTEPPFMNGGKPCLCRQGISSTRCFNGAAVHERRKVDTVASMHQQLLSASTEPPFMNGGKPAAWSCATLGG